MKNIAPTGQQERILVFDSLRGIAILGILLVNIRGFGLPFPAIDNPTVTDDLSGVNYYAWFINECILDGGFRSLLSMLFGAGMLLFIQHAEKRIDKAAAAGLLFRRQGWLLIFGIINMFFFLWFWDILSMYAVCGMVLFTFRHLSISKLFIAAAICLLVTDTLQLR